MRQKNNTRLSEAANWAAIISAVVVLVPLLGILIKVCVYTAQPAVSQESALTEKVQPEANDDDNGIASDNSHKGEVPSEGVHAEAAGDGPAIAVKGDEPHINIYYVPAENSKSVSESQVLTEPPIFLSTAELNSGNALFREDNSSQELEAFLTGGIECGAQIDETKAFLDGCRLDFDFTNTSDTDTVINQVTLAVKSVEVYEDPILLIHVIACKDALECEVENLGWKPAYNIDVEVDDVYNDFEQGTLRGTLDCLLPGEKQKLFKAYFKEQAGDLISHIETYYIDQLAVLTYSYNGFPENTHYKKIERGIDYLNSGGIGGGPAPKMYGWMIQTEKGKYQRSESINQIISAHKNARLPFFIFSDRPCEVEFNITFGLGNNTSVSSKDMSVLLFTPNYNSLDDLRYRDGDTFVSLGQQDLDEGYDVGLFYPFSLMADPEVLKRVTFY